MEAYLKKIAFRTRFGLRANESLQDRKTIMLYIQRVRETGSTLKRKPPERPKNVKTPENFAAMGAPLSCLQRVQHRNMPTVRRILHTYLNLHPYKVILGDELSPVEWGRRMYCYNGILANVSPTGILWSSGGAHLHFSGIMNKQIVD